MSNKQKWANLQLQKTTTTKNYNYKKHTDNYNYKKHTTPLALTTTKGAKQRKDKMKNR
jgi:hypothetical protein